MRRKLYFDVLVLSPLIELMKELINSRGISTILYSVMSAPC